MPGNRQCRHDPPAALLDAFARSLGVPLERVTDTYDSLVTSALTC